MKTEKKVGVLVRVVGDLYNLSGMEGLIVSLDHGIYPTTPPWFVVEFPGSEERFSFPSEDLKPIRRFTKQFAKKYDTESFKSRHCLVF